MILELDGIRPQIHPEAWIAPGAVLIGRVVVERGASVWFGAVLRGDNETITLGEGSNVQDLCVLHTDMGHPLTIGADCTVGHRAILHGCTIGAGSLIGMGAVVLNGARIGERSLVGAGALIPEGREIAAESLAIGTPGKVTRALRPDEIAGLAASAASYRANARRFRSGMAQIAAAESAGDLAGAPGRAQ
ncbi:MAG: gamma carbonic anhydrase family protein [Rubellimicrobium sp.]|nr:gamma carbonic anhydrase family protein [Rubellimicrobium sp.]